MSGWLEGEGTEGLGRAFVEWVRRIVRRFAPAEAELPQMRTLEEVSMTLVERAGEWSEQLVRRGIERGIEQGIEQGLVHERALLRRLAERKFDAATGERLAALLERVADQEQLAQVGEWVVECETGAELLARVANRNQVPGGALPRGTG